MMNANVLLDEIRQLPENSREEVFLFIRSIQENRAARHVSEMTLASEKALAFDWLKPEEDEAWSYL